jgi:hypothetical protein
MTAPVRHIASPIHDTHCNSALHHDCWRKKKNVCVIYAEESQQARPAIALHHRFARSAET